MSQDPEHNSRMIQECEAAIRRIRAAIRAGSGDSPTVGDDLERIQNAVQPRFFRYADAFRALSAQAYEEALIDMNDRLFDNIVDVHDAGLENGFRNYLRLMPLLVLHNVARKYGIPDVPRLLKGPANDSRG